MERIAIYTLPWAVCEMADKETTTSLSEVPFRNKHTLSESFPSPTVYAVCWRPITTPKWEWMSSLVKNNGRMVE